MAVDIFVFLDDSKIPTPAEWQRAIDEAEFDLELNPKFSPRDHSGYLPARLREADTGFEYLFESVEDSHGDLPPQIGDRETVAHFVLHGDQFEQLAALCAAAALAKSADGLMRDDATDAYVDGDAAVAIARQELEAGWPD